MPIDKITPKRLNYDTEERNLAAGDMTDAQNVSLSLDGVGSYGTISNVRGTVAGTPATEEDSIPNGIGQITLGQVADNENGYIYYAVWGASETGTPSGDTHAIYRYNTRTDQYQKVFADNLLNFDRDSFVKMDVINTSAENGLNTILYFTDNTNPPRKINVNRALNGDYDSLGFSRFDLALNTIKAAPVFAPTFVFETDATILQNGFKESVFQFATQYVYRDGEESAISPYSSLAVSDQAYSQNIETIGDGFADVLDNVCAVSLNLDEQLLLTNEVSKVRLLYREKNSGNFVIAKEFSPYEDLLESVFGTQNVPVFSAGSKVFRFYNDGVGSTVATEVVNKMYDNVPHEAEGQCIAGDRLMFSNYTEGYGNTPASARLSVQYSTALTGGRTEFHADQVQAINDADGEPIPTSRFTTPGVDLDISGAGALPRIDIDFEEAIPQFDWSNPEYIVEAGTVVEFTVSGTNNAIIESLDGEPFLEFKSGMSQNTSAGDPIPFYGPNHAKVSSLPVRFTFTQDVTLSVPTDQTLLEFTENIASIISQAQISTRAIIKFPFGETDELIGPIADNGGGQLRYWWIIPNSLTNAYRPNGLNLDGPNADPNVPLNCPSSVNLTFEYVDWSPTQVDGFTYSFFPKITSIDPSDLALAWSPGPVHPGDGFNSLFHRTYITNSYQAYDPVLVIYNSQNYEDNPVDYLVPLVQNDNEFLTQENTDSQSLSVDFVDSFDTLIFNTENLFCYINSARDGFKSGSLHKLGVVYFDEFNRSGPVNELGGVYVDWYNHPDRIQGEEVYAGPAAIGLNFSSEPPAWAKSYQIVYPGSATMTNWLQYTVGAAYPARAGDLDATEGVDVLRPVDLQSKRLYVSLETLQNYRSKKSTAKDYSFTVGDKLRIISNGADSEDGNLSQTIYSEIPPDYVSASDGSVIEFEVVGVEILTNNATNPIAYKLDGGGSEVAMGPEDIEDHFIGTFLVLESSRISSGVIGADASVLKYSGFDWNSVIREIGVTDNNPFTNQPAYQYSDGSDPVSKNEWGRETVVEIYSPKKDFDFEFYYEIGETRPVVAPTLLLDEDGNIVLDSNGIPVTINQHGAPFTVTQGDVHYRQVPCNSAYYAQHAGYTEQTHEYNIEDPKDWRFTTRQLECREPLERSSDTSWNRGRAHVVDAKARKIRRRNSVTYSDKYIDDVKELTLSSFNAATSNFYNFESEYGAARYIGTFGSIGSELFCVQESKFSKSPVQRSIITDAAGSSNVALTNNVLSTSTYYSGDYGCRNHPESVLYKDNQVFFFDRLRMKALRFAADNLTPISDKGVATRIEEEVLKFNDAFAQDRGKIVSGYDPEDDQYYLTLRPSYNYLSILQDDSPEDNFETIIETDNSYSLSIWWRQIAPVEEGKFELIGDVNRFGDNYDVNDGGAVYDFNFSTSLTVFRDQSGSYVDLEVHFGVQNDPDFEGLLGNVTQFWSHKQVPVSPTSWNNTVVVFDTVGSTSDNGVPAIKIYNNGVLWHEMTTPYNAVGPEFGEGYYDIQPDTGLSSYGFPPFDDQFYRCGRRIAWLQSSGPDDNIHFHALGYDGFIDDIGFFSKALTQDEVLTLYEGLDNSLPDVDGMEAFFQLNTSGTINPVTDFSSAVGDFTATPGIGSEITAGLGHNGGFNRSIRLDNEPGDAPNYIDLPPLRDMIPLDPGVVTNIPLDPVLNDGVSDPLANDGSYDGFTISYDTSLSANGMNGVWTSRHTFYPQIYSNFGNNMYSSLYVNNLVADSQALIFHKHTGANRTVFYSQPVAQSYIEVVSNASPGAVNVYDAVSYESDRKVFAARLYGSDGSTSATLASNRFEDKEDCFYAWAGRDASSNSTSEYIGIGTATSVGPEDTTSFTVNNGNIPMPIVGGARVYKLNADGELSNPDGGVTIVSHVGADGLIHVTNDLNEIEDVVDQTIVLRTTAQVDGDSIRGHYSKIRLTASEADKYELYYVNAHTTDSPLSHK